MRRWITLAVSGSVVLATTTACFYGDDAAGRKPGKVERDPEPRRPSPRKVAPRARPRERVAPRRTGRSTPTGVTGRTAGEDPADAPTQDGPPWRTVDDPPLEVSDLGVRFRRAVLSGGETMELDLKLTAKRRATGRAAVLVKTACAFGDELIASVSTVSSRALSDLEEGETKRTSVRLFGVRGIDERPDACEVHTVKGSLGLRGADDAVLLAEHCIRGERTRAGSCPKGLLPPREPRAAGPNMTPYDMSVELARGGYGRPGTRLDVRFKTRLNRPAEHFRIDVKAACRVRGETMVDTAHVMSSGGMLMAGGGWLLPGEALMMHGSPFSNSGLEGDPAHCTITVRKSAAFGDKKVLADFCWNGSAVSEGECP